MNQTPVGRNLEGSTWPSADDAVDVEEFIGALWAPPGDREGERSDPAVARTAVATNKAPSKLTAETAPLLRANHAHIASMMAQPAAGDTYPGGEKSVTGPRQRRNGTGALSVPSRYGR